MTTNISKLFATMLLLCSADLMADAFEFSPTSIITETDKKFFIHLDSSGRRLLAADDASVAVSWEDSRSGHAAVYVAYKIQADMQFSPAHKISGDNPAYEPVIVALSKQYYLIAWEEANRIWVRVISSRGNGEAVSVTDLPCRQASLSVVSANHAVLALSVLEGRYHIVHYADVQINGTSIQIRKPIPVDTSKDREMQLYPVVELTRHGSVVAWEDRRQGATRIFSAYAPNHDSNNVTFGTYQIMNEFAPPPNPEFGRGTGAMRVTLASDKDNFVAAAWMDKRNWRSGYDVFADISRDSGKTFGRDEKVQDMFANDIPQWHASIAVRKQDQVIAVAWDDTRNENLDVFYSLRINKEWSDDYELPGANGVGNQSHPAIVFDNKGVLHAVWLETSAEHVSLKYAHSR